MSNTNPPRPSPDSLQPTGTPAMNTDPKVDQLRQWNVVLMKDQDHSYNYVTSLLREVFKLNPATTIEVAARLDRHGRAVCCSTHKEHAEFKREQVLGFGRDTLVERSSGSMNVVIEPCD